MEPQPRCCKAVGWLFRPSLVLALLVGALFWTPACVVRGTGSTATQGSVGMEFDIDRPGSDFSNFDLTAASPELCRDACAADARCQAYTYVKPAHQGANARCGLKNAIPAAVSHSCCVSGVKGYASAPPPAPPAPPPAPAPLPPSSAVAVSPPVPIPQPPAAAPVAGPIARGLPPGRPPVAVAPPSGMMGGLEHDVDRPGAELQKFDLPQADPLLCQRACANSPACQSFTFVRPGVMGPRPWCSLKSGVPAAVRNPCCVSGVKPPGAMPPPSGHGAHQGGGNWDRRDEGERGREHGPDHARDHDHPNGHDRHGQGYGAPGRGDDRLEENVDRPGSDFQNFDLARPDPELCQRSCRDNGLCRAFTFVRPGVQGPNARCRLKNSVPQPVQNGCCVSGVR